MQKNLAELIANCKGIIYICGNGGLAAESDHFAAELMGMYGEKDIYIPCVSLTSNNSLLTALSNDICFEVIYEHQINILVKPEDIVIGMTTSNSENILYAIDAANSKKCITILISNYDEIGNADYNYVMDGIDSADTQEKIIHFLHSVAREVKMIKKVLS